MSRVFVPSDVAPEIRKIADNSADEFPTTEALYLRAASVQ
jgi:hypothetical protein